MQKTVLSNSLSLNSFPDMQNRLKLLQSRASSLCGTTADGKPLGVAVALALGEMHARNAAMAADPAAMEKAIAWRAEAATSPQRQSEMCAIRVEQAQNYILASQNLLSMFCEVQNLGPDERPVVQNNTMNEIRIGYTGGDSGPTQLFKVVPIQAEEMLNLRFLTTPEIRVKLQDIYRGSILDAALSTIMLAYDMGNQIEQNISDLMNLAVGSGGLFGAFTLTGNKATRVYVANSRIITANLPTSNDQVVPSTTPTTKFRYAVIRAAIKYAAQWNGAFMDGDLVPTGRILVPSVDVTDLADEIVPSSNVNNSVADELLERGWSTTGYLGRTWTLVADNTLPTGKCLIEFNKKPIKVYFKPSMDVEKIRQDYETEKNNEQFRYMRKPFGAYINSTWRPRILRLTYKNV